MKPFIYEFLFRGGETSAQDDDTWHVVIAQPYVGLDDVPKLDLSPPMPPERAAELGYTLRSIMREINGNAVERVETMKKKVREAEEAVVDLCAAHGEECARLNDELARCKEELLKANEELAVGRDRRAPKRPRQNATKEKNFVEKVVDGIVGLMGKKE